METKRTAGAVAGAALAAAVVGELLRRNGFSALVRLRRTIDAEPAAIIDLIRQVEREPELIPAVRKVTIQEQTPEGVRYRVEGASPVGPWWAVYHKWWDYEAGTIGWASDQGAYGLRQRGQINLEPGPRGTKVILTTEYTSVWPVVGPFIAGAGRRLLVVRNFRAWLDNIARVVEQAAPEAQSEPEVQSEAAS